MKQIVYLFFFLSGFSTLIYEVACVRILALTLGNTAYATSTVLGIFMGGLALGAYWGGKIADATKKNHLRLYGLIELLIAVLAPLVTLLLNLAPQFYASLLQKLPITPFSLLLIRLSVSAFLLLLPCLLMGATLPAMIRYARTYAAQGKFAALYGINTLGAACGSFSTCFLGFTYIGLNATVMSAAAINLVIGLASIIGGKTDFEKLGFDDDKDKEAQEANTQKSPNRPSVALYLLLSFLSGFTALAYEVLWIRMLTFYLGSVTYTFTTTVSTILFGLAFGSFIFERFVYRNDQSQERTFATFAIVQFLSALAAILAIFTIHYAGNNFPIWSGVDVTVQGYSSSQLLRSCLISACSLLIPATIIGASFPAMGTLAASDKERAGKEVGLVYASNTIGCVCGSLLSGLVFIPSFGSFNSFKFIVLVTVFTGIAALCYNSMWKQKISLLSLPVLAASLLFVSFVQYRPPVNPLCKLLFYGEDSLGAVEIIDDPKIMQGKTLAFNGSCLATTIPNSLRYMRLIGHLPVLLHKNPTEALVGCFGTGTTCGAISLHEQIKSLDIVELSPMILSQHHLFKHENHNVLNNPKVKTHINDVRNYLLCTDKHYDIVAFEPPPPIDAGIVNLYTSEFYEQVNQHLKPGGVVVQWMPANACGSEKLWKMAVATMRTVYPFTSVWLPNSQQQIIIASQEPLDFDINRIQTRINQNKRLQESLAEVGLDDAMALMATFVVADKELDDFLGDVPAITDNYPSLEFFLPYSGKNIMDQAVENAGLKQIPSLLVSSRKYELFDEDKFIRNWTALHLLRLAQHNHKDGPGYIDQAIKLLPDNKYLKWIAIHKDKALRGSI